MGQQISAKISLFNIFKEILGSSVKNECEKGSSDHCKAA
jgi:hypothetical protein